MVSKKYNIVYYVKLIIIINEVKKMNKISSVREKKLRQNWTFLKMSKNENPKHFSLKSLKNWVVTIMLSFTFWNFHFVTIIFLIILEKKIIFGVI
jgi:hypothetical protein